MTQSGVIFRMKIKIISASVRDGRNSHRVALFFRNYISENKIGEAEILDLKAYRFPVFEERLQYTTDPSSEVLEFSSKIKEADGVIVVTPEYNGGYPASLKNVVDLLYSEWKKKPVAIATVSDGQFGGTQVIYSLLFSFFKIGALMVPAMFPVPSVVDHYDEEGNPIDPVPINKRAKHFIGELVWCAEAKRKMQE